MTTQIISLGYVHEESAVEVINKGGEEIVAVRVITEGDHVKIRIERVDDTVPVLFEVP